MPEAAEAEVTQGDLEPESVSDPTEGEDDFMMSS